MDAIHDSFASMDPVPSRSGEVPHKQTIIKVLTGHLTARYIWEEGIRLRQELGLPAPSLPMRVRRYSVRTTEHFFPVDSPPNDTIQSVHDRNTGSNGNSSNDPGDRSNVARAGSVGY